MKREQLTEADVFALLQKRYEAPAWALLPQVADSTGARAGRRADAVAMSLYPSRGLEIHGFEIKVSRRDWLNELNNPAKADAVAVNCDRWWVVAPPGVVELPEMPVPWGLFEVGKSALRVKKDPQPLPALSTAVDRGFLAAVLRRVYAHATPAAEFERVRGKAKAEAWDEAKKHFEDSNTQVGQRYNEMSEELYELKRALGHANPGDIALAVKALRDLSGMRRNTLSELHRHSKEMAESVDGLVRVAAMFAAKEEGEADGGCTTETAIE